MFFVFCFSLFGLSTEIYAQNSGLLTGFVYDKDTNEALPAATVHFEGTYTGTITNANGSFSLKEREYPLILVVRFLGYESERLVLEEKPSEPVKIYLKSSSVMLEEIVVTDEDPAIRIMREVIKKKQLMRKNLRNYKAQAYSRTTISKDTTIVMMGEAATEIFWDKEKGSREVIKAKHNSDNLSFDDNLSGVEYLPNFYDDVIDIAEFDVFTPTHPDALANYDFKLLNRFKQDGKTVYEIQVRPKKKLQPLFTGTIYVVDEDYALLKVRLQPNDVVRLPTPIEDFDNTYEQQYSNFGGDFWLPVDIHIEGGIKIKMIGLEFPLIHYSQVSRITDYQVNTILPDSLYQKTKAYSIILDTTSLARPHTDVFQEVGTIPLSQKEERAFEEIDSTTTMAQAFKPKGFLMHFIDWDEVTAEEENNSNSNSSSGSSAQSDSTKKGLSFVKRLRFATSPDIHFNRVDGIYGGLKVDDLRITKNLELSTNVGYAYPLEKWSYGGGLQYRFRPFGKDSKNSLPVAFRYNVKTQARNEELLWDASYLGFTNLFGSHAYFDWYRTEELMLGAAHRIKQVTMSYKFKHAIDNSVRETTNYDFFGSDFRQPINPMVDDGTINSLSVEAKWGDEITPAYPISFSGGNLKVEHSNSAMGSDFDFTRVSGYLNVNFPTWFKRYFVPNRLDIIAYGAYQFGDLVKQRVGGPSISQNYYSSFGMMKTISDRPFTGSHYGVLYLQHDFRSAPFDLLGLTGIANKGLGIIVFGGASAVSQNLYRYHPQELFDAASVNATQLYNVNGIRYDTEFGVSLNNVFDLFRIDYAYNPSHKLHFIGFGITKFM